MGLNPNIFAIIRRYATAIAAGRIEAAQVKDMTDEQLEAFDEKLNAEMKDKQSEAERLAEGGK